MKIERMLSDAQREKLAVEVSVFAFVIDRWRNGNNPEAEIVLVRCPICGDEHTHGGERGKRLLGHRSAHCRIKREKGGLRECFIVDFRPPAELRR